jgi:hypothetical protein
MHNPYTKLTACMRLDVSTLRRTRSNFVHPSANKYHTLEVGVGHSLGCACWGSDVDEELDVEREGVRVLEVRQRPRVVL